MVSVGEEISVGDIVRETLEKVQELERIAGRPLKTERCWSDRSSLERYNALADTYQHLEVLAASKGRFKLEGTPKGEGSVRVRVRLLKRLLYENRFIVSAHCVNAIQMLLHLKKGKTEFVMEKDPNKHIFDAITYAILMECADELEGVRLRPVGRPTQGAELFYPLDLGVWPIFGTGGCFHGRFEWAFESTTSMSIFGTAIVAEEMHMGFKSPCLTISSMTSSGFSASLMS